MQKHDRLALEAARKEAADVGWAVDIDFPKGPKRRLILHTPAGNRYKFISSSPRNVDAEISHSIRWVRQTIKELIDG